MNWKRNQKYLSRPRHLYGLFFDNGCCYVGQTVDLKQREQQHRSARGGWQGRRFSFVLLSCITGTQANAEAHEYAWRYKAFQHGWRIYSKPPGLIIRNPRRRTTGHMKSLAAGYTWPGAAPTPAGGGSMGSSGIGWTVFKWCFVYPGVLLLVLLAFGIGR